MNNIFFCSDHHLGHENLYNTFKREDGSPARPFASSAEATEIIIQNHNKVVGPSDRVYFLGDVLMSTKAANFEVLRRFNGRKVLIKGNHDKAKLSVYSAYFDDVRGIHHFDGYALSHVPLHPQSLTRWGKNIHGHLHHNYIKTEWGNDVITDPPDDRYINVSLEHINYTPISLEEIKKKCNTQ